MKNFRIVAGIILLIISVFALPIVLSAIGLHLAALFTPSPALNEIRKKAGSDVFSKNRSGNYFRKRVKPKNPNTEPQQSVREDLTTLSRVWSETGIDRAAFDAYATEHPAKNRLGLTILLTGANWFMRFNRIIDTLSGIRIVQPPAVAFAFEKFTKFLASITGTPFEFKVQLEVPTPSSDLYYMIYVSKPLGPGQVFNSYYTLIGCYTSTGLTYNINDSCSSGTVAYACGDNGRILKSYDGFNTFVVLNSQTTENLNSITFVTSLKGYCAGNHGVLLATIDGGKSWTSIMKGVSTNINCIRGLNATDSIIVCGDNGLLMTSTDGANFNVYVSGSSSDFATCSIASLNEMIVAGPAGEVLNSINGGITFISCPITTTYDILSIEMRASGVVYAVGTYGIAFKSTDFGASWGTALATGITIDIVDLAAYSDNDLIIITSNTIMKSTDSGATWSAPLVSIVNFRTISMRGANGVIMGHDLTYYITPNLGVNWNPIIINPFVFDITGAYLSKYGAVATGKHVNVKVKQALITTGETNSPGKLLIQTAI